MQVGHSRPARLGSVLGLLLALAGAAGAKEIGTITASEVVSQLNTGSGWVPAALRTHVGVGHAIRTTTGRLAVLVFERFRQGSDDLFVLAPDTELTIEGDDAGPSYALIRASLRRGGVRWIGPGEVLAPPLGALATGTEFIVNRDPASNVAEVIVISGTVEVWNTLIDSDRVSVGAHQRTRVDPRWPPTTPETLDEGELRGYTATFDFVGGGRAEAQAANSGLLGGEEIAVPDHAPQPGHGGDLESTASSPPFDEPQPVVTDPSLRIDF